MSRRWGKKVSRSARRALTVCLLSLIYRRRKPQKVKTMGECKDRDAQFKKIADLKTHYLKAGLPVLSIDAKKREILGDYVRPGRVLSTAPLRGWDHDFPHHRKGVVIPHGIYDLGRNEGYVHLGTSHDTADFVIDCMFHWWHHHGVYQYRGAPGAVGVVRQWRK